MGRLKLRIYSLVRGVIPTVGALFSRPRDLPGIFRSSSDASRQSLRADLFRRARPLAALVQARGFGMTQIAVHTRASDDQSPEHCLPQPSAASVLIILLWHNTYMRLSKVVPAGLLAGIVCVGLSLPQTSDAADAHLTTPIVTFTLDFPEANPSHYVISVGRDGHGSYISNGELGQKAAASDINSEDSGSAGGSGNSASQTSSIHSDPPLEFSLSDRVRDQIFNLAQRAHYFSGNLDSGRKNIANTGMKTLAYQDGQHDGQGSYNYSPSVPIQQLTALFQNLSEALEFGRRLSFFQKYQKTALDNDLKRMEELLRENSLGDTQAIAPVLKKIADDQSVMNVARARALRLLNSGK